MSQARAPSVSLSEAADRAFKARLERSELEAKIQAKREEDMKRREAEMEEEERLLKKIHFQREKERKAYLQEIAAMEKQKKIDEMRLRQQEIAKRLEDIQIAEARQRDEEEARRKQVLLGMMYNRDFSEPRSSLSSYYFRRPWNHRSQRDYKSWFQTWQSSLEDIFLNAPIPEVKDLSRMLDIERVKLNDILRNRIARRT